MDMLLDRRRLLLSSSGSSRPYQEIERVRISQPPGSTEPYGYLEINKFILNKDTFIFTPSIEYATDRSINIQVGVSADSYTGQRLGACYWLPNSGNTKMASMLAFNSGSISSSV